MNQNFFDGLILEYGYEYYNPIERAVGIKYLCFKENDMITLEIPSARVSTTLETKEDFLCLMNEFSHSKYQISFEQPNIYLYSNAIKPLIGDVVIAPARKNGRSATVMALIPRENKAAISYTNTYDDCCIENVCDLLKQ